MFIRNAWYVAAWADEISQTPLARRICNEPIVLYRDQQNRAAALLDMCCHRGAPLHHRQGRRAGPAMRLPRADLRSFGRMRARPRPGPHHRAHARAQLPGGGAGCVHLDLDGRSGEGRSSEDRALAVSQRRGELAAQAHDVSDQGGRHADGRQPDGPDASGLRPHLDHRRQPDRSMSTRRWTSSARLSASVHPLDAELGAAADLCEGRRLPGTHRSLPADSSSSRLVRCCNGPARPKSAAIVTAIRPTASWRSVCITA